MLQKLNERIQGVVAWLIIVLIALTFTLFGVDYYFQSHETSNAKAIVNDKAISNQVYEANYRRTRSQQDMAKITAVEDKALQLQVLNQMITNEVSLQAASSNGFAISLNQADQAILGIPQFQEDGHFSTQKYQQALNNALFTPETFQAEVKQGMLLNQQRFAFMGSSFALPIEVDQFVRLFMQTRDYNYITIASAIFIPGIHINKDQIKKYYTSHLKEFMTPEQVSLDYVKLSTNAIRSKIKISQEAIQRYYEENQSNFLTPAQWQVSHILFSIPENATQEEVEKVKNKAISTYEKLQKNPDNFEQFVSDLSDDKLSKIDNKELPWVSAGQNEYAKILTNLTTPGQISLPEKTKHGYEIFKLWAYKAAAKKPIAVVESIIKEQLSADMAQTQYTQALEQLTDLSYQSPDSLSVVATALKLPIQKSELFSRAGGNTPITKNKQIINTAFSHDVLGLSNNSDPIQLNNNSVVVIRINRHIPAQEQSLAAVYGSIEKIIVKQAAEQKAKEFGIRLISATDEQQQALLLVHNLAWKKVKHASRDHDNDKSNTVINKLAFNLAKPGNSKGSILPSGDYAVVKLKHINNGNLEALDKEQKESLIQQIESSYGMLDYDLYINNLLRKAIIKRY